MPRDRLLDDRPILSGRHPLHLYHGFSERGRCSTAARLSCYDPAFQAGYPKTPVFDGGSRPAELVLAAAGGRYSPAAYKIGHAGLCLLAPLLLFAGGAGRGLTRVGARAWPCGLGMLVWWGSPAASRWRPAT